MPEKKLIVVKSENANERLDKFLCESCPDLSRGLVQKLIKDGEVVVNESISKSGYKLKDKDKVLVSIPELEELIAKPENIPLDIIYEDEDLIVVNKEQGMVTHPASNLYEGTLVNALLYHCKDSLSGINGILRPGIVHRLDKETSGLIIACKNDKSHKVIAEAIKNREIKRSYYAIVHGNVKHANGKINKPIGRHKTQRHKMAIVQGGRVAITRWEVLKSLDKYTLLECNLETGRTHQIRVHMTSLHHPIVGDSTYGKKDDKNLMMLHSFRLVFKHPTTNEEIKLETPMPKRFDKFVK